MLQCTEIGSLYPRMQCPCDGDGYATARVARVALGMRHCKLERVVACVRVWDGDGGRHRA